MVEGNHHMQLFAAAANVTDASTSRKGKHLLPTLRPSHAELNEAYNIYSLWAC